MRPARLFAAALIAAALASAARTDEVKTDLHGSGTERIMIEKADPTTAGTFDGTWMYVSHDARVAIWVRTKDRAPQLKLQYQSLANPEAFETDWDGRANYYMLETPVTFDLKLQKGTPDRLTGTWFWELKKGTGVRRETADVVIYRTHYGRTFLIDFQNYESTVTSHGKDNTFRAPKIWNFLKVSNRELLWDELPF